MKKLIKITALALTVIILSVFLGSCGKFNGTDYEWIKKKGKLVVGITDFEPMDYRDESGKWIGFDADYASAFAEHLGVEVEFIEIEWDSKETELENKTIDCVWNGMTITDAVKAVMDVSNPYMLNAQVIVVPVDKADKIKTAEDLKTIKVACETGSAADELLTELGVASIVRLTAQSDALLEVKSGASDAAVIDLNMAAAMTGEGTSYANLTYTGSLNNEEYGIGFRIGSDLVQKLNEFMKSYYASGDVVKLGQKYDIEPATLIEQK